MLSLEIDGAVVASGATPELIDLLESAGPFGQGNPQPRFALPAHRVKFAKVVGDKHVRAMLEAGDGARIDAIAFRAAGQPLGDLLMSAGGMPLHLAGCFRRELMERPRQNRTANRGRRRSSQMRVNSPASSGR